MASRILVQNRRVIEGLQMKFLDDKNPVMPLFLFRSKESVSDWEVTADEKFGGKSRGSFRYDPSIDAAVFEGELSLDPGYSMKKSGFVSINAPHFDPPIDLEDYDALRLKVKGDGRIWVANIKQENRAPFQLFQSSCIIPANQWTDVTLPFRNFLLTWRGMVDADQMPFDATLVERVGLLMAHRKEGPFRLAIKEIAAVNTKELQKEKRYNLI
eukprot:TRINITY_DN8262_c0_g1_i2.p1 TRINITY_DN8262_c0_g1~~TRINITY_DN8262_c0_g1_i2.p1  ORF type:complete len:225 (-),score=37.51 TRINITY_DN8262_c0_g1_i2:133-771(-)